MFSLTFSASFHNGPHGSGFRFAHQNGPHVSHICPQTSPVKVLGSHDGKRDLPFGIAFQTSHYTVNRREAFEELSPNNINIACALV